MERRFGIHLIWGLWIGVIFGAALGARSENPLLGIGLSTLFGVFAGWFAYAAAERWKERRS
ncbi:MAG: hypothetical protein R3293_17680 [Candidatus Promineifilaceae bacterium]|nr:hypothetical protein [Candidatus Promineifilaceae bacterium]